MQRSAATAPAELDDRSSGRGLVSAAPLRTLSERSNRQGGLRLCAHLGCMTATALLVWQALPSWWLLVPAMALHGVTIVTLFAPMHECAHRTAFSSRTANAVVGWVAGVLAFYNSTFYRHFHIWHHRYTQDPARDPELMAPKGGNLRQYIKEISGINFWVRRGIDYPAFALGRTRGLPFVPKAARGAVAVSMSAQLLLYVIAIALVACGMTAPLWFWLVPVILAQPFLRALLIVEHTGCSADRNGLTNTRTTLTAWPIRLLMWNMPYHAEHHLFPAVPFHCLPTLHRELRDRLSHLAPSYRAANRTVIRSLHD